MRGLHSVKNHQKVLDGKEAARRHAPTTIEAADAADPTTSGGLVIQGLAVALLSVNVMGTLSSMGLDQFGLVIRDNPEALVSHASTLEGERIHHDSASSPSADSVDP